MTPADGLQGEVGGEMQVEPPIIIMSQVSQADKEVPHTRHNLRRRSFRGQALLLVSKEAG